MPVFYAAPLHQFTTGNMGFEKQRRPGVVGFAVMIVVIVVPEPSSACSL